MRSSDIGGASFWPSDDARVVQFLRLQESFIWHVLDEDLPVILPRLLGFSEDFKATITSLQLLRGHPALEGHFESEMAALKELLGVTDPIIRDQELASIVIFSAFHRQIDAGTAEHVRIPVETDHPFQSKPITDSIPSRSPIPVDADH